MGIIPTVADMYHGNSVNLTLLKQSSVIGIIHKCSQGVGARDQKYTARKEAAEAMGFLWGAYDFATGDDPVRTAKVFLTWAAPGPQTLLCLDYEDNSRSQMSADQAYAFLDTIMQATGRAPVIYGGNRLREHIPSQQAKWVDMAKHVRLWQCRYIGLQPGDNTELFHAIKPVPPWTSNWLIQYTGDGSGPRPHQVPGVENGADLNAFAGTNDELRAQWAGAPTSKQNYPSPNGNATVA
jgi:lysozyme